MAFTKPETATENQKKCVPAGLATCLLWCYFIGIGLFFCVFFYLPATLIHRKREQAFQRLNNLFFRGFFFLVHLLFPMHRWEISPDVTTIRSSIIVCNHLSYLDPLIFIALFRRQKTIVKSKFFTLPVFGWLLQGSGYLPATTEGRFSRIMIMQMEKMADYLDQGGNLFIFPEGTRSRTGRLTSFNRGAFKIARLCKAPVVVVRIANSNKLFTPGTFRFNTANTNTITMHVVGTIPSDTGHAAPSPAKMEEMARQYLHDVDPAATSPTSTN